MKNRKKCILSALLAVMLCMAAFPLTAFAGGGPEYEEPIPEPVKETTGGYEPVPLTPEGNMTLVDDIEGETSGDKQFITVITKNGNYFYIIIDRAEDGENTVHFLNQVDEADLLALMEDEPAASKTPASCICTDKCMAGAVNTNCPVCKTDMTNCMGTEAVEPEPEPVPEKSGGMGGILVIVFILALGGGGAYYYFKVLKPKQAVKGGDDLEDFDFEDDEDEDNETFEDEAEQEDIGE
jgi:hypothetical protein